MLDNQPNILDYSKLFEREKGEPAYHLRTLLNEKESVIKLTLSL